MLALWDTGSNMSAISTRLAEQIQPPILSRATVDNPRHADERETDICQVSFMYPHGRIAKIRAAVLRLNGFDILLGMDQISKGSLLIKTTDEGTILEMQFNDELSLFE